MQVLSGVAWGKTGLLRQCSRLIGRHEASCLAHKCPSGLLCSVDDVAPFMNQRVIINMGKERVNM
jgi:hypothetical protein